MEKTELQEKYGHLGYNKDNQNTSNLTSIAFKRYENSVRFDLLEELLNELQHSNDIAKIIGDKYIKCVDNKSDLDDIEDILRGKLGYNLQVK
jgi:hypothetical protein